MPSTYLQAYQQIKNGPWKAFVIQNKFNKQLEKQNKPKIKW